MQLALVCSYYAGFAEMMQESDRFPLSHSAPCYYVQLVPELEQIGIKLTNTHQAEFLGTETLINASLQSRSFSEAAPQPSACT